MRPTDRLFELILLFKRGRLWKAADLASELGVAVRTVYRDIDVLISSGIPIEGERGVGYVLREPIFLPPLALNQDELDAFFTGCDLVSQLGDPGMARSVERLRDKISVALEIGGKRTQARPDLGFFLPFPAKTVDALAPLRRAMREKLAVSFNYLSLDDAETTRTVRPLHLECWGRVWTLTSWCEKRDGF